MSTQKILGLWFSIKRDGDDFIFILQSDVW